MAGRRHALVITAVVVAGAALLASRSPGPGPVAVSQAASGGSPLDEIIQQRGLTPDEAEAALKVFVPPGKYDDFVMITSGGHRGSIMLYGIPSMRLLKEVPVYAPDSWQGWGPVNGDWNHWDYGQKPEPLDPDNCFGELSLRYIEGTFVLAAFNATKYRIEVHVCDRVDQILNDDWPTHRCTVVVEGNDLPQLYGGYIVPGSTLDRMRILVSEWVTSTNYPYNVSEYEVNVAR